MTPRGTKTVNKKDYKHIAGKCRLCGNPAYEVLDVHRIKHGADGGKYTYDNVTCFCSNCHRKTHEGKIIIDRWYESTGGRVLRIEDEGVEKFI